MWKSLRQDKICIRSSFQLGQVPQTPLYTTGNKLRNIFTRNVHSGKRLGGKRWCIIKCIRCIINAFLSAKLWFRVHKRTVDSITCYSSGATLVRVIAQIATQCELSRIYSIQESKLNTHTYTRSHRTSPVCLILTCNERDYMSLVSTEACMSLVSTEAWLKCTWGVTLVVRLKCKSLFISNS